MIIHADVGSNLKIKNMNKVASFFRDYTIFSSIMVLFICGLFVACKDNPSSTKIAESIKMDSINYSNRVVKQDSIIIISDFQNYHTIYDLINYNNLKGNVLYFDIWSINCPPCIKEFQMSKELKDRYKSKAIKFVYLVDTRDTPEALARWDSLINKFELYGYHMRMSNKLYNNITSIHGIKFVGKPHYILVDKDGNIVYPNAERPSSRERLYSQIDTIL
jgi:thiol-disulfide isomerase/thioredoxin